VTLAGCVAEGAQRKENKLGQFLILAAKIAVGCIVSAGGILLVGGAIKKVIEDPGDKCMETGKDLLLRGLVIDRLSETLKPLPARSR
jgi:hypothetical protein